MDLINAVRPPWTDVQRRMFLDIMMEDALSKGLVGVHDAMVPVADLAFYKRLVLGPKSLADISSGWQRMTP